MGRPHAAVPAGALGGGGVLSAPTVPFRDAVRTWARVGLESFGGPAGQIAVMHRILVDEREWVTEERFLHALNYCMLLPGPEATQLAVYVGWLLHGTAGGLVAGTLFVLPGFVAILALSYVYAAWHDVSVIAAIFFGIKPAVLAIVLAALLRIGRRALKTRFALAVAAAAFVALFFLRVPFPAVVAGAAVLGLVVGRVRPEWIPRAGHAGDAAHAPDPVALHPSALAPPSTGRAVRVLAIGLGTWFAPLVAMQAAWGPDHVLVREHLFFSQMAVVTFGGAYSALTYVAQAAVERFHWLQPGEMMDGLGLAETTPGPLIMVTEFVGFLGAWRDPAPFSPGVAGLLAACVTTWATFVPCFLWIFLGAPYVEALRGQKSADAALGTITAAVVGVILNLSVWFALHVLFARVGELWVGPVRVLVPDPSTLDVRALVIAVAASIATLRFEVGMAKVILASAVAGLILGFVG